MLSTIFKNLSANWVILLANILLSFFIAPVTVNALGSVYYGIWTLVMQFTGYLWLADFGVRESVVKYVAQYHAAGQKDELVSTVRTAVSIYGVVALVVMLAVALLTAALPRLFNIPAEAVSDARIAAFMTGATIAQSFIFNVFLGAVMGLQQMYRLAPVGLFFSFFRTGLVYILLTHGHGIVALSLVQFAMSLSYSLLVYRLCRTELPYLTMRMVRPRREEVLKLVNYGKFVLIANMGDKIVFSTDSIVIATFQPVSALTFFAIGGSLVEYLRSFIASMGSLINPVASTLEARKDMDLLGQLVVAGSKAAVVLGLPVCIGFILLGERFISLWMGPAFGPQAAMVLTVLAIGFIAGLPYSTLSAAMYGLGQHRYVAYSRVIEGLVNLGLSIVLVQRIGIVGVAIGTALPHMIVVGLYLPTVLSGVIHLHLRQYYAATYLRPMIASVPFWLVCWGIEHVLQPENLATFFLTVTVSLVVYLVPCWLLALTAAERSRVVEILRRSSRQTHDVATSVAVAGSRASE